jgi:uncharacterized glyoxalase superfamily protein PhnB
MMPVTHVTPILNVADVPASREWFARLGWSRGFSWNSTGMIDGCADANAAGPATFASVRSGECEIFLCRDGQGSRARPIPKRADDDTGGVWMSWWVSGPAEVDALYALALEAGFTVTRPPRNEPWSVREFHLRHPDGHTFRVSGGLWNQQS